MKIDITELSYDPKWVEFKGIRLKVRPFPFSKTNVLVKDGAMMISGKDQLDIFKHCLTEWEGVTGADGKPLPCTDQVKEKIYDFRIEGIADFVINKAWEFEARKADEEKNS